MPRLTALRLSCGSCISWFIPPPKTPQCSVLCLNRDPNGQLFRVFATTNLALPLANWTVLTSNLFGVGSVNDVALISAYSQKFFRVGSP